MVTGHHYEQSTPPLLRELCALCVEIAIPPPFSMSLEGSRPTTKARKIRTYEKCAYNPFTIRTSKTQDLKPFRIRTYEKTGGILPSAHFRSQKPVCNIQVLPLRVPFWECDRGSGGMTRVKTLGR
jgi:hypothetical protein